MALNRSIWWLVLRTRVGFKKTIALCLMCLVPVTSGSLLAAVPASAAASVPVAANVQHWAYKAPVRPPLPRIQGQSWCRNPVDVFVLSRLEQQRLAPSREADRSALLRRLYLDLTGLPPSVREREAFLNDPSPEAYERLVERLLVSPRFGERMAVEWMDAARYADSNGYQVDRDRELWGWREWVIGAFNRNLPFDQFTIEQLAGDLLPNATLEQRIATGFNRNHMINEEGGIIAEEFLAEYCADRVETTGTVWLGLTMNCARCHDHKYDPVTQKDFYSLLAFFHNISESGVGDYSANIRRNTPPFVRLPSPQVESKLAMLRLGLGQAQTDLAFARTNALASLEDWILKIKNARLGWTGGTGRVERVGEAEASDSGTFGLDGWFAVRAGRTNQQPIRIEVRLPVQRVTALRFEFELLPDGGPVNTNGLSIRELRVEKKSAVGAGSKSVTLSPAQFESSVGNAETSKAVDRKANTAWLIARSAVGKVSAAGEFEVGIGERITASATSDMVVEIDVAPDPHAALWRVRVLASDLNPGLLVSKELREKVERLDSRPKDEELKKIEAFRLARAPDYVTQSRRVAELQRQVEEADLSVPISLVMAERSEPRKTFVLSRGAYDRPGEQVNAATPANLSPFASEWPRNRLGLARWLVDPANPLTARVTVNRLWQLLFGTGLVRTSEDFGVRGEPPSHPELLDWLATEFVRTGWDVKAMVKLLALSATYRQDARVTPLSYAGDADNRLLSRGSRYRLSAETIRDQALAASGLLVEVLGGPSVKPYHPPGLYEQVVAGSSASTYVQGKGAELYRRGLYTYWKRSVPNPAMLTFDAPFRETCAVRRSRTSTPLQALNVLNDPTYVEASRALARRMIQEGGETSSTRVAYGFQLVLGRSASPLELEILEAGVRRSAIGFKQHPEAAKSFLEVGELRLDSRIDPVEWAAYATVAGTLLNLDETLTRE